MLKISSLAALLLVFLSFASCGEKQSGDDSETTSSNDTASTATPGGDISKADASYSLGILMSGQLKSQMDADMLDYAKVAEGLEDAMNDKAKFDAMQANQNFSQYMQPLVEARAAKQQTAADEKQNAYFQEIAQKEGIQKTESGIYYEVLNAGTGASPTAESTVKVHYTGTLPDGTVFDSSVERGEPAEFPVGGVIPGWQEIVPMMKVGGKWRIHIPYALAYGERAPSPKIPAFATLVFEMELLDIVSEGEAAPQGGQ